MQFPVISQNYSEPMFVDVEGRETKYLYMGRHAERVYDLDMYLASEHASFFKNPKQIASTLDRMRPIEIAVKDKETGLFHPAKANISQPYFMNNPKVQTHRVAFFMVDNNKAATGNKQILLLDRKTSSFAYIVRPTFEEITYNPEVAVYLQFNIDKKT